jgi:hypothetical protein
VSILNPVSSNKIKEIAHLNNRQTRINHNWLPVFPNWQNISKIWMKNQKKVKKFHMSSQCTIILHKMNKNKHKTIISSSKKKGQNRKDSLNNNICHILSKRWLKHWRMQAKKAILCSSEWVIETQPDLHHFLKKVKNRLKIEIM